jgi:hypothetical protein
MSVEKYQNMSHIPSVDGNSPRGLINGAEFMKSLKQSTAWGVMASAATIVAISLLSDVEKWYTGPWKEIIVMVAGYAVLLWRAKTVGKSYLDQDGGDK